MSENLMKRVPEKKKKIKLFKVILVIMQWVVLPNVSQYCTVKYQTQKVQRTFKEHKECSERTLIYTPPVLFN